MARWLSPHMSQSKAAPKRKAVKVACQPDDDTAIDDSINVEHNARVDGGLKIIFGHKVFKGIETPPPSPPIGAW